MSQPTSPSASPKPSAKRESKTSRQGQKSRCGEGEEAASYCVPLAQAPLQTGAHACWLGSLLEAGFDVRPGFVVLPKVFEEYQLLGRLAEDATQAIADSLKAITPKNGQKSAPQKSEGLSCNGLILSVSVDAVMPDTLSPLWAIGASDSAVGKRVMETLWAYLKREGEGELPCARTVEEALLQGVSLVYGWWESEVMVGLRQVQNLPRNLPISVVVQSAPFRPEDEGVFALRLTSRHPYTGEAKLSGVVYAGAVGDDPIYHDGAGETWDETTLLSGQGRAELAVLCRGIEKHMREMVDISLAQGPDGKVWITRVQPGTGTVEATVRIAMDLYTEGILPAEDAIMRVRPADLEQALRSRLTAAMKSHQLARGKALTSGWVRGALAFDPDDVPRLREETGKQVVLCVDRLGPMRREMLFGVDAVLCLEKSVPPQVMSVFLARNTPCLFGLEPATILDKSRLNAGGKVLGRGDLVMIDADNGVLYDGQTAPGETTLPEEFRTLTKLTDQVGGVGVRANVATPQEAALARNLGAQGIGLLRTEHLFRTDRRKDVMAQLILASNPAQRREALADLLPIQRHDFRNLFQEMQGLPITIRLLDPPLYHYLPTYEHLLREMNEARMKGDFSLPDEKEQLLRKLFELKEQNPMLGLRGCRIGILYPEIYEIQVKAVFEATIDLLEEGKIIRPEILVPFVDHTNEVKTLAHAMEQAAREVMRRRKREVPFVFGIMIETPRSVMVAADLAQYVDFFSIGSNDLTQTAYGMCREDAEGRFLFTYIDRGIFEKNPFEVLDRDGVGRLITLAIQEGRQTHGKLVVGFSGAQATHPETVRFALLNGINYLSCPVAHLPVVKLLVAQEVLRATNPVKFRRGQE